MNRPGKWAGSAAALLALWGWPWLLPLPASLDVKPAETVLLDRHGTVITRVSPGATQAWGEWMKLATLAAEDHRFRLHPGVDPIGILRAARANWTAGRVVQGGSTIDQQLARRLVPRSEGLSGKIVEAGRALQLRARLGSDRVLDEYLSRTWYGNGATGAGSAAETYFSRPVSVLSAAQAATLAAIPRRPASLDPFRNPALVQRARNRVLARMAELNQIDAVTYAAAVAEPMVLVPQNTSLNAPHFSRRVLAGRSSGGEIRTGLDLSLQAAAEQAVTRQLALLKARNVHDAAVVVIHNPTREIRAYVGSAAWNGPAGQVDMATAPRSPGSALKPFLYARSLEQGHTLHDLVDDTPAAWTTTHGSWSPRNYGEGSAGPVTLRVALATSLNVPAVRLAEELGTAELHRTLVDLGISTLENRPDHYGLGLVLGDGEVRLDELVLAYATLASGGNYRPPRFTKDQPMVPPRGVLHAVATYLVVNTLDDANARSVAFGFDSALEPAYPMAAKTGTSTGFRDNWAIGVSPTFTVGVWVGNADGSEMTEVSGITGAGPILREVMDAAMSGVPPKEFSRPSSLSLSERCALSGGVVAEGCTRRYSEWVTPTSLGEPCTWHTYDGNSTPANFAAWSGASNPSFSSGTTAPTIAYPSNHARFWLDREKTPDDQAIVLRMTGGPGGAAAAIWRVDGRLHEVVQAPWRSRWLPTPGDHLLTVEVEGIVSEAVSIRVGAADPDLADRRSRE